ncbi:MAG: VWA domain-containing protein [Polyangiaceae bacterium]
MHKALGLKALVANGVVALLACGVLSSGAIGCSDDSSTGGSGGNTGGAGVGGTGGGGAAHPNTCNSADECLIDAVCDPTTHKCVDNKACTTHAECGGAAFCNAGICQHNESGGPCDGTENCISGETCTNGVCGCGGDIYGAEAVPPNVLIVLDRSSSMTENIGGGTKWDIARTAINQIVGMFNTDVRFGLLLYPGVDLAGDPGPQCGPGMIWVAPGPDSNTQVTTTLNQANTSSGTPTAEALTSLVGYSGLADTTRDNIVLLITDGQSNCADPIPVVGQLLGETPSVKTYVVGFGAGVDPTELDAMAQAGGTARPQQPFYYQADDAAGLDAAFSTIVGSVLSCNYALAETPPDPNELYVWIDGTLVPNDAANGWTYDPATNQIIFNGQTCADLQSGAANQLIVSYGCPNPPPPQ